MNSNTPPTSPLISDEASTRGIGWFVLLIGFAVLTLSTMSSCNTTRGFGRDVQKVGNKIERAAN